MPKKKPAALAPPPPPPSTPASQARTHVHDAFDSSVVEYVRLSPGCSNAQIVAHNPRLFETNLGTLTRTQAVALSLQRLKLRSLVVLFKRTWYPAAKVPCPMCEGTGHVVNTPTPPPVL
jgi:hypothetical protein